MTSRSASALSSALSIAPSLGEKKKRKKKDDEEETVGTANGKGSAWISHPHETAKL